MTKAEAGSLGGKQTFKRYGREHMKRIGANGARRFHELYFLTPVGLANFAIVRRSDNVVIGFMEAQWQN